MRHLALVLVVLCSLPAAAHGPGHGHRHGRPTFDRCGDLRDVDALTELYLDVLNTGSVDDFADIFAPDYVSHSPFGTIAGLPAFEGLMQGVYAAFPDIEYAVDDVLVDGDRVTYRYSWVGTHLGTFAGVPATGVVVHGSGMEIDRFDDGLMVESWNFADIFGIMAQITAP